MVRGAQHQEEAGAGGPVGRLQDQMPAAQGSPLLGRVKGGQAPVEGDQVAGGRQEAFQHLLAEADHQQHILIAREQVVCVLDRVGFQQNGLPGGLLAFCLPDGLVAGQTGPVVQPVQPQGQEKDGQGQDGPAEGPLLAGQTMPFHGITSCQGSGSSAANWFPFRVKQTVGIVPQESSRSR